MSWSVNSSGKSADVITDLHQKFQEGPLAAKPAGLSDDGERETVQHVFETIKQILGTFGADKLASVSASGHIGWDNYDTKEGGYQSVKFNIEPGLRLVG